ncbi:sigma-70, region 4 family protein [Burkholderia pseudomallei MSHR5608]|nr:sigma-70, region 4 family protein [Burkholderia pseudomallei MSHR5608]
MLDAFGRLSTEQRSLLLLVAVEGFSYQEVAELLDIPIGTVMSRLSRARQALRALGDGEISAPSLRLMK